MVKHLQLSSSQPSHNMFALTFLEVSDQYTSKQRKCNYWPAKSNTCSCPPLDSADLRLACRLHHRSRGQELVGRVRPSVLSHVLLLLLRVVRSFLIHIISCHDIVWSKGSSTVPNTSTSTILTYFCPVFFSILCSGFGDVSCAHRFPSRFFIG
jgi:hypothetical protein